MNPVSFVVINSADRVDYQHSTPSNFRIQLNTAIKIPDCAKIKLVSASIPNTFYNITSLNNTFGVNSVTYTIPPGSYTLSNLLGEIASLISGANPNMSISYNQATSVVTIFNNANFTFDMTLSNLYKSLSFLKQVYSGSSSYSAMYAPTIDPALYFFICFDWLGQGTLSSANNTSSFLVQNNANIGQYIFYNCNSQWYHPVDLKGQLISSLNIILRDMSGNILQGAGDWVAVLSLI
jgi:hypothetical protein